jgi:O-antigen/teichoic acid export membrane protein
MFKSKILKNGAFYISAGVFANLIPVISIAVFTRLLSPVEYGFYALSLVYGSFLVSICNFGLQIGYERDFFEKRQTGNSGGLLYTTVLFVLFSTLIGGIILFFFKDLWSNFIFGRHGYVFLFLWTYGYLSLSSIKNYFMIYFKNSENARLFLWYSVPEGLLSLPLSYVSIQVWDMGVVGLALGHFLASLTVLFFLSYAITKKVNISFDINAFTQSFKSSLLLTPRIFFGVIGANLDKILLGNLSVIQGLGVYSVGQKIGNVSFTYTTAIYNVFSPRVYNDMFTHGQRGGKVIGAYLTKFFYLTIAGILLISLFSEEVIIVLTPADYHGAIEIATIFSMLYGTYFFGTIPQLLYAKKMTLISILSIVYIIFNFFIILRFIPEWGAIGAAWGSLISGIITGIISFVISQKYYKIDWEYMRILAIFGLLFSSSIILIVMRYFEISFLIRFIFKICSVSSYFFLGRAYKIIPSFTVSSAVSEIKNSFSARLTSK